MRRALVSLVFLLPATLLAGGNGTVSVKGHRFTAEVAVSEAERAQGLMGRHELASDHCMIFLYGEDGPHPIWMKNCFISLDVAWTDKDGKILELVPDVPPPSPCASTAATRTIRISAAMWTAVTSSSSPKAPSSASASRSATASAGTSSWMTARW